jgi:hypothetical protein
MGGRNLSRRPLPVGHSPTLGLSPTLSMHSIPERDAVSCMFGPAVIRPTSGTMLELEADTVTRLQC